LACLLNLWTRAREKKEARNKIGYYLTPSPSVALVDDGIDTPSVFREVESGKRELGKI